MIRTAARRRFDGVIPVDNSINGPVSHHICRSNGDGAVVPAGGSFNEFVNGSHRFEMNRNWAIFRDYKVPEEWGGAHPK